MIAAHREAAIGPWSAEATVVGGVAALKAGAAPAALPVYLQEPTAWGTRAWDDATPGRHVASAVAAKRAGAAAWTFHQRVGYALTTESWRARLDRAGALRAELEAVGPAVAVEGWGVATVADEVTYYHLDALGSVRAVSDQTGQVVARYDYRAFGEEVAAQAGADTRRFTGKERDAESGLDYFGARYYRANLGRFTTVDPATTIKENLVDPQRWNRYAYVRNNPLRYVDPDGRKIFVVLYEPSGANRAGHIGIGVNSGATTGLYSKEQSPFLLLGSTERAAVHKDNGRIRDAVVLWTTADQDRDIHAYIEAATAKPGSYDLYDRNCADFVREALAAGGVKVVDSTLPETMFQEVKATSERLKAAVLASMMLAGLPK